MNINGAIEEEQGVGNVDTGPLEGTVDTQPE